jgi:hypothetical protein
LEELGTRPVELLEGLSHCRSRSLERVGCTAHLGVVVTRLRRLTHEIANAELFSCLIEGLELLVEHREFNSSAF